MVNELATRCDKSEKNIYKMTPKHAGMRIKKMRIVIVAKSKRHTLIYHYFKKAFKKLGHKTFWIKFPKLKSLVGERLATAITEQVLFKTKVDMLFYHGRDMPYGLLQRVKNRLPTVMYYDDCIRGTGEHLEEVIKYGRQADIMYLTNRGEIDRYREWGVNAKFITGGCDPVAHRVVETPSVFFQSDVAFIGRPNTPERVACIHAVAQRFDLKLWGSGWGSYGLNTVAQDVYASEYRKICAGAKIILGWNIDPNVDLYFSNRTWYTLGCGGFLLTLYSPSLEEIFGRGRELDWFETTVECCQKIDYYLEHEQERKKIAQAGYEFAHRYYSYEKMVEQIINELPQKNV